MTERVNRRDEILSAAGGLFIDSGYHATSIRQIAEVVGCTEAAIYYHFKDKRALLQEVIEDQVPDFVALLDEVKDADSLHDLIFRFGSGVAVLLDDAERIQRLRWILVEYPHLSPEEQAFCRSKHLMLHDMLAGLIAQFIEDDTRADHMAWTMICAGFGYGQMFHNLGIKEQSDFTAQNLVDVLVGIFK